MVLEREIGVWYLECWWGRGSYGGWGNFQTRKLRCTQSLETKRGVYQLRWGVNIWLGGAEDIVVYFFKTSFITSFQLDWLKKGPQILRFCGWCIWVLCTATLRSEAPFLLSHTTGLLPPGFPRRRRRAGHFLRIGFLLGPKNGWLAAGAVSAPCPTPTPRPERFRSPRPLNTWKVNFDQNFLPVLINSELVATWFLPFVT